MHKYDDSTFQIILLQHPFKITFDEKIMEHQHIFLNFVKFV